MTESPQDLAARRWQSGNASFRAVVVAPWVLVQIVED